MSDSREEGSSFERSPLHRRRRFGDVLVLGVATAVVAGVLYFALSTPTSPRPTQSAHGLGSFEHSPIHFAIVLKPRSAKGLANYAQVVSTPGSPTYGHFLSTAAFARRFGAPISVRRAISRYLKRFHLSSRPLDPNGLTLEISGTVQAASSALSTSFYPVQVGFKGKFPEATTYPVFPATLNNDIVGTLGLFPNDVFPGGVRHRYSTNLVAHAKVVRSSLHSKVVGACPAARSAAQSLRSYLPSQIASTYALSGLERGEATAHPVTVAMPEFVNLESSSGRDGSFLRDFGSFASCMGSHATIHIVEVDGGSGNRGAANLEEAELDAETVASLVPSVRIDMYSASQADSGQMLLRMVSDNQASVIFTTWGTCETMVDRGDLAVEQLAFEEAAAQGQSIIASSGDEGSSDCWRPGNQRTLSVDDPASQPLVTGVGGVQYPRGLGPTANPSAWNDPSYNGATGGGNSVLWSRPPYQDVTVKDDLQALEHCTLAQGCREVPDVAMLAEGFLVLAPHYGWDVLGGTSGAAPVFASGILDIEALAHHRLGQLNPLLYSLHQSQPNIFHAVTSGDNDYYNFHHGLYRAQDGYDVLTGLGTVNFARLATAIAGVAFPG